MPGESSNQEPIPMGAEALGADGPPAPAGRPLRVAVLAHSLRVAGGLSVGRNVIAAMGRVAPEHHYLVTIPPGLGYEEICQQIPHCRTVARKPSSLQLIYESLALPKIVRDFQPDVVLGLGGRGLERPPCPQAIYLQDSHYCYPSRFYGRETPLNKLKLRFKKYLIARQLRRTDVLLCPSIVIEPRMRESFGFRGRTAIVSNAVSNFILADELVGRMPPPLAPYRDKMRLLYVSKFYAHKNFEGILETFDLYRRELDGVVAVLTVAADQHPNAPKFLREVRRRGLTDRIINVGPLPQSALGGYYRNCHAMLMPTTLEAFGGPYLEAMHFELPILTSDLDFAHVACGEAAIYFDPWDPAAMRDAILRIKKEPGLADILRAKGKQRLEESFRSWDEIVRDLLALLAEMAG